MPEPLDETGLVAPDPEPPTMSRRGALALVGGGALLVGVLTAGQTIGGPARDLALLLPRGRQPGVGPNGFPINRTATAAGIDGRATGADWRLALTGSSIGCAHPRRPPRAAAAHRRAADRVRRGLVHPPDLDRRAAARPRRGWPACRGRRSAFVASLEQGPFAQATLTAGQVTDPDALLALQVNGVDLSLDHGFPARIIVPALPGVHCTKWVRSIDFRRA